MNKFFILIIALLAFISCSKSDRDDNPRYNTEIADFLYGVEYDDYDFNACKEYFDKKYIPQHGGCSEVRRGNYVGRNLDWFINRNAAAVIKINHTDDHYASIGVVGCLPEFNNDVAKSGQYSDVYKYLPFKTEDGVNECGLYVGINVMPTGETSFDKSTWKHGEYGHSAAHTNPSSSMTCALNYLPRILLDQASSVANAIDIINSIDWVDPNDYPAKGESQAFHFLICDKQHSVVLEFIDNKAYFTEAESVTKPGFGTIMTNFTNCLWQAGIMQTNGIGYERYEFLRDNYEDYTNYPDNFQGMQSLMEQVWFTKTYTTSIDNPGFWYTEYACDAFPADLLYQNYDFIHLPEISALLSEDARLFNEHYLWYTDDCTYWFSTHTSVYNLDDKTMHILVHEGRDGMKSYYEASLNSGFVKPLEK